MGTLRMLTSRERRLQSHLEEFITPRRRRRMKSVLAERTRYIICVLEDLYDPRNGSAVIRHCDALGIQEVHAVENRSPFRSDEQVDMGSAQWLDLKIHPITDSIPRSVKARRGCPDIPPSNTPGVLESLKQRGYRIIATTPHAEGNAVPETLNLASAPLAIVFGSEKHGVSPEVKAAADEFLRVPMLGFVESLNISACAAICLYVITRRLRSENLPWPLTPRDAEEIYFRWVCSSAPHSEQLIQRFLTSPPEPSESDRSSRGPHSG